MNRYLLSLLGLVLAATIGAGCRKSSTPPSPSPSSSPTSSSEPLVYLPPKTTPDPKEQTLQELRSIIQAFQATKSFRANVTISNAKEKMTGKIEVVKPDRFHGNFQLAGDVPIQEFIGVQDTLYVRLDNTWKKIVSPTLTQALKNAFQSTMRDNQNLLESQLTSSTVITKNSNPSQGCTAYQTTIKEISGMTTDITICAAKGLPKTITLTSSQGSATIEYIDYNALFTIERPTVME